MNAKRELLLLRIVAWAGASAPLLWMAWRILLGEGLGADPTQTLTHWSGFTAVTLLVVGLAVTPVRRLTGWNRIQKLRRMLGLWAFFYATVHVCVYVFLDQAMALDFILEDVLERPFTLVGAASFLLLIPLALTSTRGWIRRLGRNWVRLHWLVYPAAALGVLHYELGQKTDLTRGPVTMAVILGLLLGLRLWFVARGGSRRRPERTTADRTSPDRTQADVVDSPA